MKQKSFGSKEVQTVTLTVMPLTHNQRMSKKNITINDIARSLDIAPSTVSRALNDSRRISEATRQKVRQKARELGYELNLIASSLSKHRTGTMGLVVPNISQSFFSLAVSGIESVTRENDCRLIIAQSNESLEREKDILRMFQSYRVDGVIASLSIETNDISHFKELQDKRIPLVLFDRVHYGLECTRVVVDNYEGAFKAASHLISSGCRRPAHLGGPLKNRLFRERADGFAEALAKHGTPLLPNFLLSTDLTHTDVQDAMRLWMNQPEPPDGIFTASASTGLLLTRIARNLHIRIPDDLALITFGNEPCHEYTVPSLSAIDMPGYEMGSTAAEHLFRAVSNPKTEKKLVIKPLQLYIRNSTLRKKMKHVADRSQPE